MALPVNFDADSAARIYRAVREVERGNRDQKPLTFARVLSEQIPRVFRLGTFSGAWAIGADKAITLEGGTATLSVRNLFYPITATVTDKSCAIARSNGSWLLLAVPMQTATAIEVSSTATILRISPGDTIATTVSSLNSPSQASYVNGVSAVLNTTDCSISLTLATATFSYVSSGPTAEIVTISAAATATAAVVESTAVIQYLRFES